MKERPCITIFLFLCILISGVLSGCRAPEEHPQSFSITISNTSGADLIIENIEIWESCNNSRILDTNTDKNVVKNKHIAKTITSNKVEKINFEIDYEVAWSGDLWGLKIECYYKDNSNLLAIPFMGSISSDSVSKLSTTSYSSGTTTYYKTSDAGFKSPSSLLLNFVKTSDDEYVLCIVK